jgi:hypothetical protein
MPPHKGYHPRSRLLELERLDTRLCVHIALVRGRMSNLIRAVVIEEEVQSAIISKACRCDGARSSILCDTVALPGLHVAKAKDLLAITGFASSLLESGADGCGSCILTITEVSFDGHSSADWQCQGNRQEGRCGEQHLDGCSEVRSKKFSGFNDSNSEDQAGRWSGWLVRELCRCDCSTLPAVLYGWKSTQLGRSNHTSGKADQLPAQHMIMVSLSAAEIFYTQFDPDMVGRTTISFPKALS